MKIKVLVQIKKYIFVFQSIQKDPGVNFTNILITAFTMIFFAKTEEI
jgi:hypothetical protein